MTDNSRSRNPYFVSNDAIMLEEHRQPSLVADDEVGCPSGQHVLCAWRVYVDRCFYSPTQCQQWIQRLAAMPLAEVVLAWKPSVVLAAIGDGAYDTSFVEMTASSESLPFPANVHSRGPPRESHENSGSLVDP